MRHFTNEKSRQEIILINKNNSPSPGKQSAV
jgi:hypothetical protein